MLTWVRVYGRLGPAGRAQGAPSGPPPVPAAGPPRLPPNLPRTQGCGPAGTAAAKVKLLNMIVSPTHAVMSIRKCGVPGGSWGPSHMPDKALPALPRSC